MTRKVFDAEYFGRWKTRSRPTKPLPRQQQSVLDFCRAEVAAGRDFPTKRAIADHMGWKNVSGSNDVLNTLVGKGHLARQLAKPFGWTYSLPTAAVTEAAE